MDMRLKEAQRPPLQRQQPPALEATDTESFNQGRVDQERLSRDNDAHMGFQSKEGVDEDDEVLVFDSLDVAAHTQIKSKVPSGGLETQMDGGDRAHLRFFSDDDYTDLKYDPDWRRKLNGAGCVFTATQSSMEDAFQNQPTLAIIKGGYRYISDTSPVVTSSNMAAREAEQPYLLHTKTDPNERSCQLQTNEGESMNRFQELTQNLRHINAVYMQEYQNYYSQEAQQNQGGPTQTHTIPLGGPRYAFSKRPLDDIVERNKVTFGRPTDKRGSYMRMHVLRQDTTLPVKKELEYVKEAAITLDPNESSDPETRWLQKTQLLKANHINRARKYQRNENPDLSQPKQPHVGLLDPQTQTLTSTSQALDPLFQENNSSLVPQDAPNAKITATSPHRHLYRSQVTKVQFIPEGQKKALQESFFVCLEGLDKDLDQEKSLELCPSTSCSQGSSAYTVLPPIGKVYKESQEMFLRSTQTFSAENIQPTEQQKQEKQRVTYKTYTLKDYKKLLPEVKLQGLGPDFSAVEKTKMKRLRQYSEVIREQNKKISRVPFLVAKDPEGTDQKVPRMKALEYAKTIAKPRMASQLRPAEKAPSDGVSEHPSSLQDKTAFQLDTLENLRKRHEQEKKTVAHFRKFL